MNCSICNKQSKNLNGLMQHIRIHNITPKKYYSKFPRKTKVCYVCKKEKKSTEFYEDSYFNDGLSGKCKECHIKKVKERRAIPEVKIHRAKYEKEYREKNREKVNSRKKEWKHRNGKEEYRKKCREEYYKNPLGQKRRGQKYSQTEKGKLSSSASTHKRLAKKKELKDEITRANIEKIYLLFENKCMKCNSKKNLELDHFYPLSRGNPLISQDFNACILCRSCNASKGSSEPSKFFNKTQLNKFNEVKKQWQHIKM